MSNIFNPDEVTIVRKKDDGIIMDRIATRKMLPGSKFSGKSVRENVISRLRNDPSVLIVMEDKDGKCEERVEHAGFLLTLTVQEGEHPFGRLQVSYGGHLAYEATFTPQEENGEDEEEILTRTVSKAATILRNINRECYDFVDENCPGFQTIEPEEELEDMYDIARILEENNFEVERLHTVEYASNPCLFVFENELVLLAEHHFYGNCFVEIKRLFIGVKRDLAAKAVEEVTSKSGVTAIHYKDGSWGFRLTVFELTASNLLEQIKESIDEILRDIEDIENYEGIGAEPFDISDEVRALFTYEVLDASVALSKLDI